MTAVRTDGKTQLCQAMTRMTRQVASVAASAPAGLSATVATQHAEAEPDDRTEEGRAEDDEPERQGRVPEQEVDANVLPVLEHEDEEDSGADQRHDGARAEGGLLDGRLRRRLLRGWLSAHGSVTSMPYARRSHAMSFGTT